MIFNFFKSFLLRYRFRFYFKGYVIFSQINQLGFFFRLMNIIIKLKYIDKFYLKLQSSSCLFILYTSGYSGVISPYGKVIDALYVIAPSSYSSFIVSVYLFS